MSLCREQFEVRYPVPAGVLWCEESNRYALVEIKTARHAGSTIAGYEVYVQSWGVWKASRDQLKAENEALRRDATRYRFLRNQHWPAAYLAVVVNPKTSVKLGHDCPSGARLDEEVDGAMKREASHD
ncbi:hypothetical protein [Pseudomonas capsici]|uniref:hypothetical protein n=1 Tax=Pseudomonas capsici TaxID=2810614 RepID=UPI0021F21ABC|nr:hypothetical protein [Pseudomonas capsici]MCV4285073.1 hypothetical protein [Pseudomonas capsici]